MARADLAVRRFMLGQEFTHLRSKMPDVLGDIGLNDLGAIHYNCTPPHDSGFEQRRYKSNFLASGRPGITAEELKQIRKADEDFKMYFEALPSDSLVTVTFVDRRHRVLGSRTYNK